MTMMMVGFSELLILLLTGGAVTGGGLMGYPPGERDAALLRAAPADALVYAEWAERSGGTEGAPGVDGLAADPEIRVFVERVERAILTSIRREVGNGGPEARVMADSIPEVVRALLVRPGSIYLRFNEEAAAKGVAAAEEIGPAALALGIEGAIVVNAGDGADDLAKHIGALLDLVPGVARNADLARQVIPLPIPATLEVHREGDRFIVAFGEKVAENVAAALGNDDAKGIGASERYTKGIANADVERVASVSWVDVKGILETTIKVLGVQGLQVKLVTESLGLDAIDNVVTVNGVVDGRMAARSFVTTGGSTRGLLALVDGRPLTKDDLAGIPADADLVFAVSLDAKKLFAAAREVVLKADPSGFAVQQMNGFLEQLDGELEFSIEKDAVEAFGDVWALSNSPGDGGLLLTAIIASLDVRDHEKAKPIYDRILQLVESTTRGVRAGEFRRRDGEELRREEFMGHEIAFVNVLDDDMIFTPSFCLTKTHLLFATTVQAMKARLRFLEGDEAHFGDRTKLLGVEPTVNVIHLDARPAVHTLYSFVPYMSASMFGEIQREGGEISAFSVPSARAILPYAKDSFGRVIRKEDGVLVEWHNGIPVPGAGVMMMQFPVFLLSARAVRIGAAEAVMEQRMEAKRAAVERIREAAPANEQRAKAERVKREKPAPRAEKVKAAAEAARNAKEAAQRAR